MDEVLKGLGAAAGVPAGRICTVADIAQPRRHRLRLKGKVGAAGPMGRGVA